MNMIKTPVNGMRDIEPREMELRQFILSKIREVYKRFGFTEIETPNIEHIENLLSDLGWDNEKLIFKIMKRGDKLVNSAKEFFEKAKNDESYIEKGVNDFVDSGLRYDLTVPLCRFYANNKDKLISPFKAMQIGNVYRADRPQKGRFRQFMQCDIDMFGEETNLAEIETLLATSTLLKEIKFDKYNFSFDINDRRLLRAMNKAAGFKEADFESVCITLDKLDKIGKDGVKKEFIDNNYDEKIADKFLSIVETANDINTLKDTLGDNIESGVIENLIEIIETVTKNIDVKINFNPTLVRGMGYYTGPIFEVKSEKFSGSVGGGGRYDKMVGKFAGTDTPAIGISIGFERIIGIYMDDNFTIPSNVKKIAYLIEKDIESSKKSDIIKKALEERKNGNIVYIAKASKNKKFQRENLEKLGYTEFVDKFD